MPSIFWEESLMMLVVQWYSALAFLKKCNCGNSLRVSLPVKRQKTCINWIFCTQHISIISLYLYYHFFRKALWVTPPHSLNLGVGHWLIFLTSLSTLTASMKAHRLTNWPNFVGVLISFLSTYHYSRYKKTVPINTIRFLNFGY